MTFYGAVKQARKDGYTHFISADGEAHELPTVPTKIANLPKTGWLCANFNGTIALMVVNVKTRKPIGYYELRTEAIQQALF